MRIRQGLALLGLVLACQGAYAHDVAKPEAAITYRQSVYKVIYWNFQPMVAMIRNQVPFDAVEFARRAARLEFLSQQLLEGFPKGSDQGAMTEAKPEIWQTWDDFKAHMDRFVTESAALKKTAKGGDEKKIRAQFTRTAEACKACHDKYRAD